MSEFSTWLQSCKCSESDLTLPKVLSCNKITLEDDVSFHHPTASDLPFAVTDSQCVNAQLISRSTTSSGKEIIRFAVKLQDYQSWPFQPGDTIGILPENKPHEVDAILEHLGLTAVAKQIIEVTNLDPKRNYLPKRSSYRELISKNINLRALPMKQVIATLATFAYDDMERRTMNFLASREGAADYFSVILNAGTTLLDFLTSFPSCKPPVEVLLQCIPRLMPRPYSIASSPLDNPSILEVVASILPGEQEGLCTGMLRRAFAATDRTKLSVYLRKPNGFRLPESHMAPLVLVGPGTGVAPFVGFLNHLRPSDQNRRVILFTGFRREEDFVYRKEINAHLASGTLSQLFVSYSDAGPKHTKYVQEAIRKFGQVVAKAISDNGYVYVCGDFKKMTETVSRAIEGAIAEYSGISHAEAADKMKELRASKRYLEDIWI